jgi:hypothetical protein
VPVNEGVVGIEGDGEFEFNGVEDVVQSAM